MEHCAKKKILSAILTIVIFCLSFVSCGSNSSVNQLTDVNFEAACLIDTNVIIEKKRDITLIKSSDELENYKASSRFAEAEDNVVEKMNSYSADFFDTKMLIVIHLMEPTYSSKITVEGIDFTDGLWAKVTLKRTVPRADGETIRIWSIFVETDARNIESANYTVIEEIVDNKQ